MRDVLAQGSIIEASVLDTQGRNPKRRPLVIISPTEQIQDGEPFYCAAITGSLPTILPDDHVLIPYSNSGRHPYTGLSKRCAAVCSWAVRVKPEDVIEIRGTVPTKQLQTIINKIAEMLPGKG